MTTDPKDITRADLAELRALANALLKRVAKIEERLDGAAVAKECEPTFEDYAELRARRRRRRERKLKGG